MDDLGAGGIFKLIVACTVDEDERPTGEDHCNERKSALDPVITHKLTEQIAGHRARPQYERLTEREMEVLELTAQGYTNKVIGLQLGISLSE